MEARVLTESSPTGFSFLHYSTAKKAPQGFGVLGLGQVLGSGVWGSGFWGFWVWGLRVWGFWVWGLEART